MLRDVAHPVSLHSSGSFFGHSNFKVSSQPYRPYMIVHWLISPFRMKVFVKIFSTKTISLEVQRMDTIRSVKDQVVLSLSSIDH